MPQIKPSFWNFVERSGTKCPESPLAYNRSLIEKMVSMKCGFISSGTTGEFKNELPAIRSNAAAMHKSQRFRQHNHYYRDYASNFSRLQKRMDRPDRFQKPVRSVKREDTALSSSFATRADEKNVSDVWVHWKCTSQASSLQTRTRCGLWETLHNPDFKGVEFDRFKKEAGLNSFNLIPKKWIGKTFGKGDTAQAVPQAPRLRSMTFVGKIASLGNLWGYWIKFISLCCINFSSMTGNKKPLSKTSFWNFVQCNETKYPESPFVFNRSVKITSLENLWGYWIKFIPLHCINFSSMTGSKKHKNTPMEHVPLERNGVTLEKLLNTGEAGKLAPIGAVSFSNPGGLEKI